MKILLALFLCFGFVFASVDINKANEKDFASLKGVGDKKASMIVQYRKTNGCFKSVDDLSKVKGIGKKTIEKNRDELTISKCK